MDHLAQGQLTDTGRGGGWRGRHRRAIPLVPGVHVCPELQRVHRPPHVAPLPSRPAPPPVSPAAAGARSRCGPGLGSEPGSGSRPGLGRRLHGADEACVELALAALDPALLLGDCGPLGQLVGVGDHLPTRAAPRHALPAAMPPAASLRKPARRVHRDHQRSCRLPRKLERRCVGADSVPHHGARAHAEHAARVHGERGVARAHRKCAELGAVQPDPHHFAIVAPFDQPVGAAKLPPFAARGAGRFWDGWAKGERSGCAAGEPCGQR